MDPPLARTCPCRCAPACWRFPPRRWWSVLSSTAWWQEGWTSHHSLCSLGSPPMSNRWCGWSGTLVYLHGARKYYLSHSSHLNCKSALNQHNYTAGVSGICGSQLHTTIKGEAEPDDQRRKNDLLSLNPQRKTISSTLPKLSRQRWKRKLN